MAVKIKLKRLGKIREPYYRIVVADARTKRDGRAIEEIGKYHPKADPSLIEVNSERVQHWLSVGAQPTDPVRVLLKVTGDWQKFTGEPGAEGTLRTAAPREDKKEPSRPPPGPARPARNQGRQGVRLGQGRGRPPGPPGRGGRAKAASAKAEARRRRGREPAEAGLPRQRRPQAERRARPRRAAETAPAEADADRPRPTAAEAAARPRPRQPAAPAERRRDAREAPPTR